MIQPKDNFRRNQLDIIHLKDLIPKNHLLLKVDPYIQDDKIFEKLQKYYPKKGRMSLAPHELMRSLVLMYIYEIESFSEFSDDFAVNLAYKWFVGLDIEATITQRQLEYNIRRFEKGVLGDLLEETISPLVEDGLIEAKLYPSMRLTHILEINDEHNA